MSFSEDLREAYEMAKHLGNEELIEKLLKLREQAIGLEESTEVNLIRSGNCYYKEDDTAQSHPYCLTCWDSDRKLISLLKFASGKMLCQICDKR